MLAALDVDLSEIVHRLQSIHHARTRVVLDEAARLLASVFDDLQANARPLVATLDRTFASFRADLLAHLRTEEIIVFPYVIAMSEALATGAAPRRTRFSSLASPIQLLRNEQDGTRRAMGRLFRASAAARKAGLDSPRLDAFEAAMKVLEADLEQHIALEQHVLFPAAVLVEQHLAARGRSPGRPS